MLNSGRKFVSTKSNEPRPSGPHLCYGLTSGKMVLPTNPEKGWMDRGGGNASDLIQDEGKHAELQQHLDVETDEANPDLLTLTGRLVDLIGSCIPWGSSTSRLLRWLRAGLLLSVHLLWRGAIWDRVSWCEALALLRVCERVQIRGISPHVVWVGSTVRKRYCAVLGGWDGVCIVCLLTILHMGHRKRGQGVQDLEGMR